MIKSTASRRRHERNANAILKQSSVWSENGPLNESWMALLDG